MNEVQLKVLCMELIDYLEWIGWGDSWERECSEDLRKKVEKFKNSLNTTKKKDHEPS